MVLLCQNNFASIPLNIRMTSILTANKPSWYNNLPFLTTNLYIIQILQNNTKTSRAQLCQTKCLRLTSDKQITRQWASNEQILVSSEQPNILMIVRCTNDTSLAVKGALTHYLQRPNAYNTSPPASMRTSKIQKGRQGPQNG